MTDRKAIGLALKTSQLDSSGCWFRLRDLGNLRWRRQIVSLASVSVPLESEGTQHPQEGKGAAVSPEVVRRDLQGTKSRLSSP